jgi:hypothetical protein
VKYFLAFIALIASIGLASFLVTFSFKGVPAALKIDRDTIVKYQQDKADFCNGDDAGLINYDYGFKFSKTTTDTQDDTDVVTSEKDGFSVYVPADEDERTSDLPEHFGQYLGLTRIANSDYAFVLFGKYDTSCGRIDYKGDISEDQIKTDFGPDFFNQGRLANSMGSKLVRTAYPDEAVRSADYVSKPPKIFANGQTYIGAVMRYVLDKHTVMSLELGTFHKNTLILYSVIVDATGEDLFGKDRAEQALHNIANEIVILK